MPRLFVERWQLGGSRLVLGGEDQRYLTRVLRVARGAPVDLFDGRGLEVAATVVAVNPREVTLELGERREAAPRSTAPVTLLQGLARAERMDLVVQKATELGVGRIVPVRVARSATGQQGRPDRWQKIAREAARQCGRADVPALSPVEPLAVALRGLAAGGSRLLPWEDARQVPPLAEAVPAGAPAVALLIGPEGGLTAEEVAAAVAEGFVLVTLGPRILRTETAAIAALAVVQSRLGGMG